jgi:hypothetical protein
MNSGFAWGYKKEHLEMIENYMKLFTIICLFNQTSEDNLERKNKLENGFKIFIGSQRIEQKVIKCYTLEDCIRQIQQLRDQKIILIIASNEPLREEFSSYQNVQYITSFASNIENINNIRQLSENKSWLSYLPYEIINKSIEDLDCQTKTNAIEQLMIEILLRLPRRETEKEREDFIIFSRSVYSNDTKRMTEIGEYKKDHLTKSPIQWYTSGNFTHRIVNRTFREGKINSLYKIRHFCCGIYSQLTEIDARQRPTRLRSTLHLYRGRRISQRELNFFYQHKGTFVISNSFVSTSTDKKVADSYISGINQQSSDDIGVIFSIIVNVKNTSSKPIAFIDKYSQMKDENEVLLPPGIVLRIDSVEKTEVSIEIKYKYYSIENILI